MDLHVVSGGIGKQVAFTSVLNKFDEKVCVSSHWPDVYKDNIHVEEVYPSTHLSHHGNEFLYKNFKNIIHVEPYCGNMLKGGMHLIEAYHEKLGLKCDGLYHTVNFSKESERYYSKFIEELEDFVLVQFTGSDKGEYLLGDRNLNKELSQEIINVIRFDFNIKVIDVNEGQTIYENIFTPRKQPQYREYLMMMKHCKTFIGIDSSLNHMSAYQSNPISGLCLWRDKAYAKMFEYPHNTNIYSKLPAKMNFDKNYLFDCVDKLFKK
tara:strand:- start:34 stop:828 length:795 start_codon:yes stop_codon:yes gene_type:complete